MWVKKRKVKFTEEEKKEIEAEIERLTKKFHENKRKRIENYWNKFRHLIAQLPPNLSGAILLNKCDIDQGFAIFKLSRPINKDWYRIIMPYGKFKGVFRKKEFFKIVAPEGQPEEYSNYFVIRDLKKDETFERRMIKFFNCLNIKKHNLEAVALVLNRWNQQAWEAKQNGRRR